MNFNKFKYEYEYEYVSEYNYEYEYENSNLKEVCMYIYIGSLEFSKVTELVTLAEDLDMTIANIPEGILRHKPGSF